MELVFVYKFSQIAYSHPYEYYSRFWPMHHFVHFSISYLGNVYYYMDVINAQKLLFNYVPLVILPIILFMLVLFLGTYCS